MVKKQLLLGVGLSALLGFTPALAEPPPVAPYNWTGFYLGGNIGYSWGRAKGELNTPGVAPLFSPTYSNSFDLDGVIGGGQIGYNWQYNNDWVFGLEADIQASAEKGSSSNTDQVGGCPPNQTFCEGPASASLTRMLEANIRWFGTLRGRIGFLVTPEIMLYGTGGAAYGDIKVSGSAVLTMAGVSNSVFGSTSDVNWGWTAGGGVEGAFPDSPRWTWKVEYLYLDFGSLGGSGVDPVFGNYSWNADVTDHVVRVGVNYRFNGNSNGN